MSEQGTEQGTPQRRKKAREQGDVVRSRELLAAVALLAGVLTLGAVAMPLVGAWRGVFEACLGMATGRELGADVAWRRVLLRTLAPAGMPLVAVMAASFLAALVTGVAQGGGLTFTPGALGLKFERLNPVENVSQLFSLRSAVRIAKSLVPAGAMVAMGWFALRTLEQTMPVLATRRLPAALGTAYGLMLDAAWITLGWSGLDYAIEWTSWNKRMRMTKQQIRDEMKEAMGNPQVKGRVRQAQNAMRRRKVKADISRASVVITNPTHYAVALAFSFDTMQAPVVLAKGRDLHAAEIREEARWAGVPMIENPPLARSLYRLVEPGQSIPFELYAAVAGILAYLYRQQVEAKAREERARSEREMRGAR